MVLNWKSVDLDQILGKNTFHSRGGEALEQVAQRCFSPGNVKGQVGWSFEQPGLVEGLLACGRQAGIR